MKEKIYITGHKNPDTDSICAALAYADLKRHLGVNAEAIRLGELNRETTFVLNYFNVEAPRLKTSIKPQVRDVSIDPAHCINPDFSLHQTMEMMSKNNIGSLPVVDQEEQLIGIVSLSNISNCYMEVWDDEVLGRSQTTIENIIEVLKAKVIYLPKKPRPLSGKMAIKAIKQTSLLSENDIVILGDDQESQKAVLETNVSLIILTASTILNEDMMRLAEKHNVTVLSTALSTFMAARILPQSVPVSHVMTKENLVVFHKDDLIDDVRDMMGKSRFRSYPVLNDHGKVIGNISRYHLITDLRKKIILVDHNEKNQSIDDIESADILEIVDHHRVANISTSSPVYFRNEPVGSTSTIISKMYFESGNRPSKNIAGLLCAAIISDTLLFRSPTATETDRYILNRMAKIAGINVEEFAMQMFKEGTSLAGRNVKDLLSSDVKDFIIEEEKVRIGQIFTMDLSSLQSIETELRDAMKQYCLSYNKDTFLLMITDIFNELSQVIVVGKYAEEIAKEFDAILGDDKFVAKDLLSRKKQMIPAVTSAIVQAKTKYS